MKGSLYPNLMDEKVIFLTILMPTRLAGLKCREKGSATGSTLDCAKEYN